MTASSWLKDFTELAQGGDGTAIANAFVLDGFWRDYLPFGGTLQTLEGRDAIARFGAAKGPSTGLSAVEFEGDDKASEGFFRFQTHEGSGRGYIRMDGVLCHNLFTMQEGLSNAAPTPQSDEPFVLVVGGGQGGLALGAQLQDLGVPYLIVDKYPRVGDQWRSRYKNLVLHDPVWYDHLPFKPFPADWPVFTPKDQMADWLEVYAKDLGLQIWTDTTLDSASYDDKTSAWTAQVTRNGDTQTLRPTHLVMALGLSGFAKVPKFEGQDVFAGQQYHSSSFTGGEALAGRNVVIVGANNSAHDIATDLVGHGAKPVMIQRSSTLVVNQADYCERILGPLYSAEAVAKGITADKADILQASLPLRLFEPAQRRLWDKLRANQASFYQQLTDAGFNIDFAEDGTGLGAKYRRTASGYYIDVGAAQMVIDGRIAIRSGHGIARLSETAVHLESGEALSADAVIYATGYGDMTDWVAKLIDVETAEKVGLCWGYGSGTKGDPGPWIGEQRNMWVETAQPGLWLTGGNLSQARYFSRLLALQLAKRYREK